MEEKVAMPQSQGGPVVSHSGGSSTHLFAREHEEDLDGNNSWPHRLGVGDGQYEFRKNKGCEAPTLQVLNALEEAEEAGTEIHGSS